MAAVIFYQNTT